MKTIKLLIIPVAAMILLNCNNYSNSNKTNLSQKKAEQSIPETTSDAVSIQFIKSEFDSGKEFYLLDVRTKDEYSQERLIFADDQIPYDSMELYRDRLPKDKEKTIYLFCRSSRRSGIATEYLRSLGYTHAYNITGGLLAWQEAGYETVSNKQ